MRPWMRVLAAAALAAILGCGGRPPRAAVDIADTLNEILLENAVYEENFVREISGDVGDTLDVDGFKPEPEPPKEPPDTKGP